MNGSKLSSELYSVRSTPRGYRMVKFDSLLNVQAVYEMRRYGLRVGCACFQANKDTCRHRAMVALFVEKKAVDSGRFYDYEQGKWLPAVKGMK